jgi:GT2 family glycosyltransferase
VPLPTVSVIIVTWNGLGLLKRFLPSVLATAYPNLEVIVADNGSTDGTVAWLASEHPNVILVRHPTNWLFARGNNQAVSSSSGQFLCFLNNDVEVSPDWLNPLIQEMDDPSVVAVQPKLLQLDDRSRFEYAGASGGFLDAYGYPFTRGRLFSTLEADSGQYDDTCDIFWATGAAFCVRRDAFQTTGGFDESFGMHMEEIDLCWRLQRLGGRIRVVPKSTVYHLGGASLPQGDPRKAFLNYRNGLVMLAKNLPRDEFKRVIRARHALDTVAILRAHIGGNQAEARAIRRAWKEFRSHLPEIQHPSEAERVVLPSYRRSIVVDYFLRGKRTYSELQI